MVKVRAAILEEHGGPVRVRTVTLRDPGEGEVLVEMLASGVCHSDLHAVEGNLPLPVPMVLGHEGVGIVRATGPKVRRLMPGDRVVLRWVQPCGECRHCRDGHVHLCSRSADTARTGHLLTGDTPFSLDGAPAYPFSMTGTLSEATVVPEEGAIKIPEEMPIREAAMLGCAVLTGVGAALNTAQVKPGQTVAVFGLGGVGLNIVQGARIGGASRIIGVDPILQRRDLARRLGATHVIDPNHSEPVGSILDMTHGEGADITFEAVGTPETIQAAFNASARGGLAVIAGVCSPHLEVSLNAFAFPSQGKAIRGTWYGDTLPERDIPLMHRLYREGALELRPMLGTPMGLDDIDFAFESLVSGRIGRPVISFGPGRD